MKKIIICFGVLLLTNAATSAALPVKDLLQLRTGSYAKGLENKGEGKDYSYEIEIGDNHIASLTIDFSKPVAPEQYIKKDAKGFCLVQKAAGDIHLNRLFFFNQETSFRYEITEANKIKSILVKDIPGARANKACSFSELVKLGSEDNKIQKVK